MPGSGAFWGLTPIIDIQKTTLALVVGVSLSFYLLIIHLTVPPPIPGIPYKRRWRWMPAGHLAPLGTYWLLSGEAFSWFSRESLDLKSPIVQIFLPTFSLRRPTVILADLPEIEEIAMRKLGEMDRASLIHDMFGFIMPNATFSMKTNDKLKSQRRLWGVVSSSQFLHEVAAPRFHESISRLIDLWKLRSKANNQQPFRATDDLKSTALDAIGAISLGLDLGMLQQEMQKVSPKAQSLNKGDLESCRDGPLLVHSMEILVQCLNWVTTSISVRLSKWVICQLSYFRRAQAAVTNILNSEINAALVRIQSQNGDQRHPRCGLQEVLKRNSMFYIDPSTQGQIRDELFQFLIFGHETTSAGLGWALKHLADNQAVQARLRSALFDAFGLDKPGLPTASDIASTDVPYLDAFIAEVLRVSYPGPVAFRETITGCQILGVNIPAGTPVLLVTGGPSHLQEYYTEYGSERKSKRWDTNLAPLDQFVPERWMRSDGTFNAIAGPSLPFSTGARGCFGRKIALLEMKFMISMLLLSFEFPELESRLSTYGSTDAQIRRPTQCYVQPM
ncbi:cytochrome P450 monooxygenase [Colletotrichum nymphaeae SA-01]|uniref:Cytochrome P450 monooxygenase n=1 Tax=Colletotrichum nymphaeae SA-01 TaxID=1460502 RepID=A0A135T0W4_9PEZI|nr:cytochrome P450 monooxygenase [Colletotrichum nymphaeae SA-01]